MPRTVVIRLKVESDEQKLRIIERNHWKNWE